MGKMTPAANLLLLYLPKEPGCPPHTTTVLSLSNQVEQPDAQAPARWVAGSWGRAQPAAGAACSGGRGLSRVPRQRGIHAMLHTASVETAQLRGAPVQLGSWAPGRPAPRAVAGGSRGVHSGGMGHGGRLLARDQCDLRRSPQELDFAS